MRIGRVASLAMPSLLIGSMAAGLGCDAPKTGTALEPEGAPEILQVFVTERVAGAAGLGLYYNANEDYFAEDGTQCGTVLSEENGDDCLVTNAVADATQKIRIVFDELLAGDTVEEFFCACAGETGDTPCPNNILASLDPTMCADNPNTNADEGSRWEDKNGDGLPDRARLLGGVVIVTCDDVDVYTTGPADGFYNPSGNQQIPVATGLAGLGPALVITASGGLRTNADCTIKLAATVTDKEGTPVPSLPSTAATFHTEAMALLSSTPENNATGVARNVSPNLQFNSTLDESTLDNIVLRLAPGGATVPAEITLGMDKVSVTIDPTVDPMPALDLLTAGTKYEIVIPVTLTDAFGGPFPMEQIITFTTGAM